MLALGYMVLHVFFVSHDCMLSHVVVLLLDCGFLGSERPGMAWLCSQQSVLGKLSEPQASKIRRCRLENHELG